MGYSERKEQGNGKNWDKHNRLLPHELLQSNFMAEAKLFTQSDVLLNKCRGNTLKNIFKK